MKQIKLQQGESFTMTFVIKENETPSSLNAGEYIAIGFYDELGCKYVLKSKDYDMKYDNNTKVYSVNIPGSITQNFVGNIDAEIVIYNDKKNFVSHADNIIKLYFQERKINMDI